MTKQPNWYGLEKLPLYLDMSQQQLEDSRDQLETLLECKKRPHVLDDHTVDRVIKVYAEQAEDLWVYIEQCKKWRMQSPSSNQLADIEKVEKNAKTLEEINQEILSLAHHFKLQTIERILETDDAELAIKMLQKTLFS
jgi:hypothetical protein